MHFPQFRKYKNNLSYFKIESNERFIEWKRMTNKWEKIEIEATILPDRVFIADMLEANSLYWDNITETEFNSFLKSV